MALAIAIIALICVLIVTDLIISFVLGQDWPE